MKLIFGTGLTLLFTYHLVAHFIHAICEVSPEEARHRLNHWLLSLLNQETPSQNASVFLCEGEWRELGTLLEKYFNTLHLQQFSASNDGTISVIYDASGIRDKYQVSPDTIKLCITHDTHRWFLEKLGYEVPLHIQTLTEDCLHFKFAFNSKGVRTLNSIREIQKQLLNQPKKYLHPKGAYHFVENTNSSLVLGIHRDNWYEQKCILSLANDLNIFSL